ncbi:response regulator [Paenibacillus flagellatus]|nr:response regulator [Paenibacillus flagellatus]
MTTMKRIVLIDDEPLARQHIRERFPWSDWGFAIAGEAANGEEALELCRSVDPDIALIDITMPVMDGLTLLGRLKEEFRRIRTIMLTAHRDFGYVQSAMQLGAVGYILKSPVDLVQTKAALDRACEELERDSRYTEKVRSHQQLIRNYNYSLREQFFENVLTGSLSADREIVERGALLDIKLKAPWLVMAVCRVDAIESFGAKYNEIDRPLAEFSLLEIVRETLQDGGGGFELFPLSFGQFVIVMTHGAGDLDESEVRQRVTAMADALERPLERYLGVRLWIGVSPPFRTPASMRSVYAQTEQRLSYSFYRDKPGPLFWDRVAPYRDVPEQELNQLIDDLKRTLASGDAGELDEWAARMKLTFRLHTPEPYKAKRWLDSLKSLFPDSDDALPASPWPNVHACHTLHEAALSVAGWMKERKRRMEQARRVRPEIRLAIQYIRAHLQDELTLEAIADHIQLSASYMGHLFKKEIGTSVMDYILEQRIERAKSYLVSGRYRNYELAEKAGFRNYSHFCTMFKKYAGMTPNEFKNKHKPLVTP